MSAEEHYSHYFTSPNETTRTGWREGTLLPPLSTQVMSNEDDDCLNMEIEKISNNLDSLNRLSTEEQRVTSQPLNN